jgi:hypothetical protein
LKLLDPLKRASLFLVITLVACSGGQNKPVTAQSSVLCKSTPIAKQLSKPVFRKMPTDGVLRAEPVKTFVGERQVLSLDLTDQYVAWAGNSGSVSIWKWVSVYDLRTGQQKKVAELRSEWRAQGTIEDVRIDRETLIYKERAKRNATYEKGTPWAIRAVDLVTGKKQIVAESTNSLEARIVSSYAVDWPWVVVGGEFPKDEKQKTRRDAQDLRNLIVYDLRSGTKCILIPDAQTEFFDINKGYVFYENYSENETTWYSDLSIVPVDGSVPPTQITHGRKAVWMQAGNGAVTWEEQLEATGPTDEKKYSPWIQVLSNEHPIRLDEEGTGVRSGDGFAVWERLSTEDLFVGDPFNPKAKVSLTKFPSITPHWRTHNDLVVWATNDSETEGKPYEIHVVRITKG